MACGVSAIAAVFLAGCGAFIPDRRLEPQTPVGGFGVAAGSVVKPGETPPADAVTLDLPRLIAAYTPSPRAQPSIEDAIADFDKQVQSPDRRLDYRNAIVGAVLMASEKNCEVYVEYLHGNQVAIRAFSSALATVLSGAAAVTTPVATARVLAALGAASSGAGANIDQAAFSKLTVETIVAGIRANQGLGVQQIRGRMTNAYSSWPLSLAIRDALEVHDRCDAISALSYLQGAAQSTATGAGADPATPPSGSGKAAQP